MQAFGYTLDEAQDALRDMKQHVGGFIETAPSPDLPVWATTAAHTSDAYLVQLATSKGFRLATFDRHIRDSSVELIA